MGYLASSWQRLRQLIVTDPLPPEAVAKGWALGMFIGCSVPFGLQLMVSVPLAFALRVSKVGATVGTLITNPVSIFFIYPAQTWIGCRLIGHPLSWEYLESVSARLSKVSLFRASGWETLGEIGARVLGGYFLGGLLLAAVLTPLTYFAVRRLVTRYRARRTSGRQPRHLV